MQTDRQNSEGHTGTPAQDVIYEVKTQISSVVSKLPVLRNSREAHQPFEIQNLGSKPKNSQGKRNKWSQIYLYFPLEVKPIGSPT